MAPRRWRLLALQMEQSTEATDAYTGGEDGSLDEDMGVEGGYCDHEVDDEA